MSHIYAIFICFLFPVDYLFLLFYVLLMLEQIFLWMWYSFSVGLLAITFFCLYFYCFGINNHYLSTSTLNYIKLCHTLYKSFTIVYIDFFASVFWAIAVIQFTFSYCKLLNLAIITYNIQLSSKLSCKKNYSCIYSILPFLGLLIPLCRFRFLFYTIVLLLKVLSFSFLVFCSVLTFLIL